MLSFTRISPERHVEPSAERAGSLGEALATISAEFALSRFASKERVDLAALAAAGSSSGASTLYAQAELIPDDVFAAARAKHAVCAHVLVPGAQAVVALYDAHGPIKGLPPNERATRLAAASGAPPCDLRGSVFVVRLAVLRGGASEGTSAAATGADFVPAELAARETLEAAQAANAAFAAQSDVSLEAMQAAVQAAVASMLQAAADGASAPAARAPEAAAAPVAERLSWKDAGAEVIVTVAVPAQTTRADVTVVLKPDSLCARVRTLPAGEEAVVDGRLFQRIDVDESNWALESVVAGAPTRALVVTLTKEKQMRWLQLTRRE
jgi:hypothetical protein